MAAPAAGGACAATAGRPRTSRAAPSRPRAVPSRRLRLPAALPSIFTTARFAIGLALASAYFAETKALDPTGLGVIGQRAALDQTSGAETLWTTIFCTAALGIVGLLLLGVAERSLLRWHASQRR